MKRKSFELCLDLTHDQKLIEQKYNELLNEKISEFESYIDVYLDLRMGQFFLVIVYNDN
jgi:hypothetical protein